VAVRLRHEQATAPEFPLPPRRTLGADQVEVPLRGTLVAARPLAAYPGLSDESKEVLERAIFHSRIRARCTSIDSDKCPIQPLESATSKRGIHKQARLVEGSKNPPYTR
jgi:hypothetical protein